MNESEAAELDLGKLAASLLKRWWALLLAALIGGGAALAATSFLMTPQYTATVKLYVNNSTEAGPSITSSDITASKSLVETCITIIRSDTVLGEVLEATGHGYSVKELDKNLAAGALNATEVFYVSVTDPSAARAAELANAIADAAPRRIAEIVDGSSLKVVDRAGIPAEPSSPSYAKNVAAGAAAGLALMLAGLTVATLLDTRINEESDLGELPGMPVLGVISDFRAASRAKYGYGYGYGAPAGKAGREGGASK